MPAIKTILVPVDFSECSRAALERAGALARRLGAAVHVLHVWELPEALPPGANEGAYAGQLIGMAEKFAETKLHELTQDARAQGLAIAESLLEMGSPPSAIAERAKQGRYDLLVLGTHGRKGLSRVLLGSVAEKVVRTAPCPVLTVHGGSEPRAPAKVLVPVDYSEGSKQALTYAVELARLVGAELEVVHVWDRPSFVTDQMQVETQSGRRSLAELVLENAELEMQSFLASCGREIAALPHRLLSGQPAATLVAELERGEHDLVVMGTRGRTGLKHLVLGSVAEKLVRHSPVAVLTVPTASVDG